MGADTVLRGTASADPVAAAVPNCGSSSQALNYNTTTHAFGCQSITGTATPGGATTNVQFNNAGSMAGDSGLTYAGSGVTFTQTASTNGAVTSNLINSSAGTSAQTFFHVQNDAAHNAYYGLSSSTYAATEWGGGPTGEQIFIGGSGNIPVTFGQNNTIRLSLSGAIAGETGRIFMNGTGVSGQSYWAFYDQAGTRFGYFGKAGTSDGTITYESDAALKLTSNNGTDSIILDTTHFMTYNGHPVAKSLAWTANYVGNGGVGLSTVVAVSWPIACADIPGSAVGASSATTFSVGTLPADAQPTHPQTVTFPPIAEDNGVIGGFTWTGIINTNGTVTFLKNNSSSGWTNSGQKGVTSDTTMCYFLN
jgi:hypothetical protein